MLGFPLVTSWPRRGGPIPWILDPAKHPRPDDPDMSQNLPAPGSNTNTGGDKSRKRKKRNGKCREFKVTQKGTRNDEPMWVTCSSSSGSDVSDTTAADSGVNLASPITTGKGLKKAKFTGTAVPAPGSNVSRTPPLSPDTRQELDVETMGGDDSQPDDDAPLSGHSGHPSSDDSSESDGEEEMFGMEEFSDAEDGQDGADSGQRDTTRDIEPSGAKAPAPVKDTVTPSTSADAATTTTVTTATAPSPPPPSGPGVPPSNPGDSDPTVALAYAIQARILASPALAIAMAQMGQGIACDGGEEDKARQEEYAGVMTGLRVVTRIMSVGFEKASEAVQKVISGTLEWVVLRDWHFIEGASSNLMRWIRAVQPAIDGLGWGAMAEICLRSDARRDGMQVAWEILNPYGVGKPGTDQTDLLQDIIVRAFAVARQPTELAIIEVHEQLAPLTSEFVPPGQERTFLARVYNVICSYVQEVHSMVLGQAVVPTQIVPGIWGALWGILAEAPLLAPQIGPAEVPTPPKEVRDAGTTKKAETGTQSEPAPPLANVKPSTAEVPAQRVPPQQLVALMSNKKSPAKSSKSKSTPGSGGRRSHTQQSVHTLWNDPERRREDEAFERVRAQGRRTEPPVIIMEDVTAEFLLAQQRTSRQASSSSCPTATASRPEATTHSSTPVPQDRTRRFSPTLTRPASRSLPMPASFQLPTHRKRENTAPPDPGAVIVVQDDDEPLTGTDKPKGSAKKAPRVYTAEEEVAWQDLRQKLHSDCQQLQYANEFENFKKYRESIQNLRGAPNTDDHTKYLQEHVLTEQKQSYAFARNLLTVKAFQKRL